MFHLQGTVLPGELRGLSGEWGVLGKPWGNWGNSRGNLYMKAK